MVSETSPTTSFRLRFVPTLVLGEVDFRLKLQTKKHQDTSTAETVESMIHFLAFHNYMGPVNSLRKILIEGGFKIAEGSTLELRCFIVSLHNFVNSVIIQF